MRKDPSAAWMPAGAFYWLGYAGVSLLIGVVRFASAGPKTSGLEIAESVSNAWSVGLVGALFFALGLLMLSTARPCQAESMKGSAALGALTGATLLALGVAGTAAQPAADVLLICASLSAILLHFFTPRLKRLLPRSKRTRPAPSPLSIVQACQAFGLSFALLSILWFIAFSSTFGGTVMIRLGALPVLFFTTGMYSLITAVVFGAGVALAYYARGVRTLRAWYCAATAVFTIALLLLESSLQDRFGYYLNEVSWLMLFPALPGLGAVLVPAPRKTA